MAMMVLSMIFVMVVIISQASAERICQVLQEESTVQNPAQPVTDMADGSSNRPCHLPLLRQFRKARSDDINPERSAPA